MSQWQDIVSWQPWGREVFHSAHAQDRPVLLVLEQSWCALSRMLHSVAWNNVQVAESIHTNYLPVLVDAGRRPDIDRRYRMGGWPTIAFLTPDGKPIAGSTFLPPEALVNALDNTAELFHSKRQELLARTFEMDDARLALRTERVDINRAPSPWMTSRALEIVRELADREFGGFGTEPKFPHFDAVRLLLGVFQKSRQNDFLTLATDALDAISQNSLYDWDGSGFFRYCESQDWTVPGYEKLLMDQADHLAMFVHGWSVNGTAEYLEAAEGVIRYLTETLYDHTTSAFAASQASDAGYYQLSDSQRTAADPPEIDRTILTDANARAARSLSYSARLLQRQELADLARKTIDRLYSLNLTEGGLFRHAHAENGDTSLQDFLADQAEMALALLELNSYQHDSDLQQRAVRIAEQIHRTYHDPQQPGYFDSADPMGLGLLDLKDKSFDDNMLVADLFARIGRLTGDSQWETRAISALAGFTGIWEKLGIGAASYGLALFRVFAEES